MSKKDIPASPKQGDWDQVKPGNGTPWGEGSGDQYSVPASLKPIVVNRGGGEQ